MSERQAQLTDAVQQFKPGQLVRGQVLRLEDYGALISIYNNTGKSSGVQGLLHKSEMSWDVLWTVDEVVQTGEGRKRTHQQQTHLARWLALHVAPNKPSAAQVMLGLKAVKV